MKDKIVLVGDWSFDEHWITGTQRIATSSRIGSRHRFVKNDPKLDTIYASGAGRSARIFLHHDNVNVTGIGIWELKGVESVASFFTDSSRDEDSFHGIKNEYYLNWDLEKSKNDRLKLINIQKEGDTDPPIGTTRYIRIHEKIGESIKIAERIDFEVLKRKEEISNLIRRNKKSILEELPAPEQVKSLVIKDLEKGVVCGEMIDLLVEKYGKDKTIEWSISTKIWKPDWFGNFKNIRINLLIIPQVAAHSALEKEDLDTWITSNGFVTLDALKILEKPVECLGFKKSNSIKRVVLLPRGNLTIGANVPGNTKSSKDIKENKPKCSETEKNLFIYNHPFDKYSSMELPMASVFFPELIYEISCKSEDDFSFVKALNMALEKTNLWRQRRFEFYTKEWELEFKNADSTQSISAGDIDREPIRMEKWIEANIAASILKWEAAYQKYGIVGESIDERIELWRAMTLMKNYIVLSPNKRRKLRELLQYMKKGKDTLLKRPEVCFIKADPGSGKSFLVDCIAEELDLLPVQFNISQLTSKAQLIDCFDKISTIQAGNKDRTLLVFFDEINTEIGKEKVYSSFLAPLEDGYYLRGQNRFQLSPCFWVFVGTDFYPTNDNKGNDFQSRFTFPIVELNEDLDESIQSLEDSRNSQKKTSDEYKYFQERLNEKRLDKEKEEAYRSLEIIYYCLVFIRKTFKPVTKVSLGALKIFSKINTKASIRSIRQLIESIRHIPFEEINTKCLLDLILSLKDEEQISELFGDDTGWIRQLQKMEKADFDRLEKMIPVFD